MQYATVPQVTGSHGKRTWGLKLVCGILPGALTASPSTSHYLVASVHLTHPSHEELQSTTHQEYEPQKWESGFHGELQRVIALVLNNLKRKADKTCTYNVTICKQKRLDAVPFFKTQQINSCGLMAALSIQT